MNRLKDKVAIITGASGIGEANSNINGTGRCQQNDWRL